MSMGPVEVSRKIVKSYKEKEGKEESMKIMMVVINVLKIPE